MAENFLVGSCKEFMKVMDRTLKVIAGPRVLPLLLMSQWLSAVFLASRDLPGLPRSKGRYVPEWSHPSDHLCKQTWSSGRLFCRLPVVAN